MQLLDIFWKLIKGKPETATRWPSWLEVTSKPGLDYALLNLGAINKNTRYVKSNPFGNATPVVCIAEVYHNGRWSGADMVYVSGGMGTKANFVEGVGIVIQTGVENILSSSDASGGGHGSVTGLASGSCRVHVWRIHQ